jgi:hypothetical protein
MDNKKFEALIDLIINENEEQARALFHDIVVEKSREIYESMMDDESVEEGMGGQVGGMLDEIGAEESGVVEADEELDDLEIDDGDEVVDFEAGEESEGDSEVEERLISIEDKLDELMAEFEEIMGSDDGEDFGDEEGAEDFGADDEEGAEDFEAGEEAGEEEALAEAINLKQVPGLYGSKIGGDNGENAKSIALNQPKVKVAGVGAVKAGGSSESVPTSPKAPSNAYTKGETQVKGAGSFKNAPAQNNFSEKGEKAPAPVKSQASGVNNKSVVEGKTSAKKRI